MKILPGIFLLLSTLLFTGGCSSSIRQFYPDAFYKEDNIYRNKAIGFLIKFDSKWDIITDPNLMNRNYRGFAKSLQGAGGELLFMGTTLEKLYGTKAIAINLNESPVEYAQYIRSLNSEDLENDSEPQPFETGTFYGVQWIYDKSGYRFVEYFFLIDTYNIRLSFWTRPALFENFRPVFENIMSSTTRFAGY